MCYAQDNLYCAFMTIHGLDHRSGHCLRSAQRTLRQAIDSVGSAVRADYLGTESGPNDDQGPKAERCGISVVRIPEEQLQVLIGEAREGFQEHVSK